MIENSQSCLSPDLLQQIGRDEVMPETLSRVEQHVTNCHRCRCLFESAYENAEWRDEIQPALTLPIESVSLEDGIERESDQGILQLLGPTDDPRMLGRIGTYEIVGIVGRGGMGVVFKAFDAALDRYVAIKILAPHLAASAAARKRFSREGQAAAAVVDDHVLPIYGVDQWQGIPYLVMQYSRGISLQQRIRQQGPLQLKEILRIGMQTARGLAAAHSQGLVHRDVKPSNILISATVERAVLTDFGLARAVDDASMTRSGIVAGTPQYMSPEQARAESVEQKSDQFSLGAVLYSMCTGHAPFRAETSLGVMRLITDRQPRPIQEINPEIPQWLCTIVSRMMEKEPEQRFDSTASVATLLQECLAHVQQPSVVPLPDQLKPGNRLVSYVNRFGIVTALGLTLIFCFAFAIHQAADPQTKQTGTDATENEPDKTVEVKNQNDRPQTPNSRQVTPPIAQNQIGGDQHDLPAEIADFVAPLELVFFQARASRIVPAVLVDTDESTFVVTAGTATLVPDSMPRAIDRIFVHIPGKQKQPANYLFGSLGLSIYEVSDKLTNNQLGSVASLVVGDQLSVIVPDESISIAPDTTRVTKLDASNRLEIESWKLIREYHNLFVIDKSLPEGTVLLKNGKLAGIVLLGTRFGTSENSDSYAVPADRIRNLLGQSEVQREDAAWNQPALKSDDHQQVQSIATEFYKALHENRVAEATALLRNPTPNDFNRLTQLAKLFADLQPHDPAVSITGTTAVAVLNSVKLAQPHPDVGESPRPILQFVQQEGKWKIRDYDLHTEATAMKMLGGPRPMVNEVRVNVHANSTAIVMLMHPAELKDGNKVQQGAASVALGQLLSSDYCGFLQYTKDGVQWLWGEEQGLVRLANDRAQYVKSITTARPGDLPTFDSALKMSLDAFANVTAINKRMIILTDGDPVLQDDTILNKFRDAKIEISVVHVLAHEKDYDEDPRKMARVTNGRYYRVRNASPAVVERLFLREARMAKAVEPRDRAAATIEETP